MNPSNFDSAVNSPVIPFPATVQKNEKIENKTADNLSLLLRQSSNDDVALIDKKNKYAGIQLTRKNEKFLKIKRIFSAILPNNMEKAAENLSFGVIETARLITKDVNSNLPELAFVTRRMIKFLILLLGINDKKTSSIILFNKNVDKIKNDPEWTTLLKSQVARLSKEQIIALLEIPPRDLRGFDREFLHTLYAELDQKIKADDSFPEQASLLLKLKTLLSHYETKVWQIDDANMKHIGGGAVNKVSSVVHDNKEYVFKPDLEEMPASLRLKETFFGTAAASGIPTGVQGHFADRSVLSYKVDTMLYGEENGICVKTEFAIINGQRGILMEKVPIGKIDYDRLERKRINLLAEDTEFIQQRLKKYHQLSARDLNLLGSIYGCKNVEIIYKPNRKKGEPIEWKLIGDFPVYKNDHFNPKSTATARDLAKALWEDELTWQTDRHPYNYSYSRDGGVKCFDNDCSWGATATPDDLNNIRNQPAFAFIVPNNASLLLNPPDVITFEVKGKIDALYNKREEYKALLELHLNEKEVDAAMDRLGKVHVWINRKAKENENRLPDLELDHLEETEPGFLKPLAASTPPMLIVNDQDLLSREVRERSNVNNSYLERDLHKFDPKIKGWNYLRK